VTKDTFRRSLQWPALTLRDSRTNAGNDSSGSLKQLVTGSVGILHWSSRLVSTLGWYIGSLKLLTGIAALSGATAILALSGRRSDNQNSEVSLRLVPLILAAFSLLLFTNGRGRPSEKDRPLAAEKVRTG
jgi:hypothetical protein